MSICMPIVSVNKYPYLYKMRVLLENLSHVRIFFLIFLTNTLSKRNAQNVLFSELTLNVQSSKNQ